MVNYINWKISRRQFLLGGLAAASAATVIPEYLRTKAKNEQVLALLNERDTDKFFQQTLEADAKKINEARLIQASVKLSPPPIPYNREISQLLIQCSKLATQQYLKGKIDPSYNGDIKSLPAYTAKFKGYTQVTAIKGVEAKISEQVEVDIAQSPTSPNSATDPIGDNVGNAQKAIENTAKEVVKIKKKIPVYFGFVLSSKNHNIIVFRGTQRTIEWVLNINAVYATNDRKVASQSYGAIHPGFSAIYSNISSQTLEVAKKLNPSVPCYISGHSLGAAIATLAAIDIAVNIPRLQKQVQLYTYASPRVGDRVFAREHNRVVPNSYRVVNLADAITLVPFTVFFKTEYVHVGEEWAFLAQNGDVMPNHVVDTYKSAIDKQAETNKPRNYPNSGLK
ncbi:MAG: lipase family protein [Tychonema bourrellyi B0820]|uniref:lipase family protein n=1 Tax=Tychonema bourrellyi TaxID=54313 RepID=UPI0011807D24|nr:lipase family protein [Tychonema bourrellyi]MDQ2098296.1 lipase family protein [Tychonema bourrellyi B0820]